MLHSFHMLKRQWEESNHLSKGSRWSTIYVSMSARGRIAISDHTHKLLGECEAVLLLFDRVNSTIGIAPSRPSVKNSYRVAPRGRYRGRVIRAHGFTQEFGIRVDKTMRFTNAELDADGILVLDLRNCRPVMQSQKGNGGSKK
ncbi:MAG: hypothetical protein WKF34_11435 [Pyrinomonadaceae bacterium]